MQKIVFCNITMKKAADLEKSVYKVNGNSTIDSGIAVFYPINGVLAKILAKNDKVKVVMLKKEDSAKNCDKNVKVFKRELDSINKKIGAKIEYKELSIPLDETRKTQETLLQKMINELNEKSEIYADITFSVKSLPIITFSVLNYAQKFMKADIKSIVYGQAEFNEKKEAYNHTLFDMTALFYLNAIVNNIEGKNGNEAKKILEAILNG